MKLLWSSRSPFVRKVMVAAEELRLTARIEKVPTLVAMTAPNHAVLAISPLGRIPVLLLADGTAIYDSLAIIEYLNELGSGALFPPAGAARVQALRWHALATGLLEVLVLWRSERERAAPHHLALEGFAAKARATLNQLEAEAGAISTLPFGIGHVALGCCLGYLDFRFDAIGWRSQRPGLAAWYDEFAARPSAQLTAPRDS